MAYCFTDNDHKKASYFLLWAVTIILKTIWAHSKKWGKYKKKKKIKIILTFKKQ